MRWSRAPAPRERIEAQCEAMKPGSCHFAARVARFVAVDADQRGLQSTPRGHVVPISDSVDAAKDIATKRAARQVSEQAAQPIAAWCSTSKGLIGGTGAGV
jgi:hypothetical protein